jgi:predicted amidohydrolase
MSNLDITTLQTDIFWEDKKANLDTLAKKIKSIKEKTGIIVLPEMFNTGFSLNAEMFAETMDGETIYWMKDLAAEMKVILTGSIMIKENGNYFNRLLWVLPNKQLGYYDKRHLFAYSGEDELFSKGNKRLITSVNGWKILVQVCYDLRFPVWSRQQISDSGPEYDLLINVANWPQSRNHAWETLLVARAIENQCYVVGVNRIGEDGNHISYNGNSMIIGPTGEQLYHVKNAEEIFTMTLDKEILEHTRKKYPFWKDGDRFFIQ